LPKKDLDSPEAIRKMRKDIDFDTLKNEIIEELNEKKEIVLSTAMGNRVTSRTVSFANDVLTIYFTSWEHNKKILQINVNPKVALTLDRIQIEGIAEILGRVTENDFEYIKTIFLKKYSKKYIDTFFAKPEMVLVKIVPFKIVKFCNIDRRFHFQVLDLKEGNACQMRLEDKDHPKFPY
jgi:general stress protein 26